MNDELLTLLMGKCWHSVEYNVMSQSWICSICNEEFREGDEREADNPDFSTSPDDRERLWEYLMGKKDMWRYFQDWTYDVWEEDVDLVERGTSWNTEADRAAWLHKPLDGVQRWVSLLSDWLGMEETREKWGISKCPHYPKECNGCYRGNANYEWCESCDGTGRIRAEWAKEVSHDH